MRSISSCLLLCGAESPTEIPQNKDGEMALNLVKAVIAFLKERPEEKFTARQIADWVFATYPDECQAKKNNSQALDTDADLVQQIVREISSQMPRLQKKQSELKTTEGRPRKYYYSEKSDSAEVFAVEGASVTSAVDAGRQRLMSTPCTRCLRCPGNSGHYRFKRLPSSRTGRRQPAPGNQAVSGDAGGCKKSRCTPGWRPRPLHGLQRGDGAPFRS